MKQENVRYFPLDSPYEQAVEQGSTPMINNRGDCSVPGFVRVERRTFNTGAERSIAVHAADAMSPHSRPPLTRIHSSLFLTPTHTTSTPPRSTRKTSHHPLPPRAHSPCRDSQQSQVDNASAGCANAISGPTGACRSTSRMCTHTLLRRVGGGCLQTSTER